MLAFTREPFITVVNIAPGSCAYADTGAPIVTVNTIAPRPQNFSARIANLTDNGRFRRAARHRIAAQRWKIDMACKSRASRDVRKDSISEAPPPRVVVRGAFKPPSGASG